MNSIQLIGRLGKDPELRTTQSGKSICNFSLAVESWRKDDAGNRVTNWFNVTCFDKTAEVVCTYRVKGDQLALEGSIEFRRYTDKDGNTRDTHDVIASRVHLIGGRSDKPSGPSTSSNLTPAPDPNEFDPFADE